MDFTMVIPVLIAFVLSVAAGPVVIPVFCNGGKNM